MNLLLNIGGTKTEAALWDTKSDPCVVKTATSTYKTVHDVVHAAADGVRIDNIMLAIAGPVMNGAVTMTNGTMSVTEAELISAFNLKSCTIVNDAVAGAWSLMDDQILDEHTKLFVTVGTGLGGAMVCQGACTTVVPFEPGRMGYRAIRDAFANVAGQGFLQSKRELEDVLSGAGLTEMANEIASRTGTRVSYSSAKDVFAAAKTDSSSPAGVACHCFWNLLAGFCADMTLMLPNLRSIHLSGSVVLKNVDGFLESDFHTFYCNKISSSRNERTCAKIAPVSENSPEISGLIKLHHISK